MTPARLGDGAPDFTLPGSDGTVFHLAEVKGVKHVVLAFYPKDFTSG